MFQVMSIGFGSLVLLLAVVVLCVILGVLPEEGL